MKGRCPLTLQIWKSFSFALTCEWYFSCVKNSEQILFSFRTSTTLFHCKSLASDTAHKWSTVDLSNTPLQKLSCLLHDFDIFSFLSLIFCGLIWCIYKWFYCMLCFGVFFLSLWGKNLSQHFSTVVLLSSYRHYPLTWDYC